MNTDFSPYSGGVYESKNGRTCFGKIISTDPKARTCRVKTLGVKAGYGGTDDLDLHDVRFISLAAHPEGDEDTYIPRPGQFGAVIYINAEPYIFGYYMPPNATGNYERSVNVPLDNGDRIIKMIAGNRIILRAGGTVEIESTKLCRTYWIPSQNLINSVCQNYELETDGGYMYWLRSKEDNTTQLQFMIYNNVEPTTAVDMQIGTADSGDVITLNMGDIDPDTAEVKTSRLSLSITPKGDTSLNIGPDKVTLKIAADSGNIDLTTKGNITQTIDGNVTQTVKGDVTETIDGKHSENTKGAVSTSTKDSFGIDATGAVAITTKDAVSVDAKSSVDIKSSADTTVDSKGNATIKSLGAAEVKGTAGTTVGSLASVTNVLGSVVNLGGGGLPVALVGSQCIGVGNLGVPVISNIVQGSTSVTAKP